MVAQHLQMSASIYKWVPRIYKLVPGHLVGAGFENHEILGKIQTSASLVIASLAMYALLQYIVKLLFQARL